MGKIASADNAIRQTRGILCLHMRFIILYHLHTRLVPHAVLKSRPNCMCLQAACLQSLEWHVATYIIRSPITAWVPAPRHQDGHDSRLGKEAIQIAKSYHPKLGGYTDVSVGPDGVQFRHGPNACHCCNCGGHGNEVNATQLQAQQNSKACRLAVSYTTLTLMHLGLRKLPWLTQARSSLYSSSPLA